MTNGERCARGEPETNGQSLTVEEAEELLRAQIAASEERTEREDLTLNLAILYNRTGRQGEAMDVMRGLLAGTHDPDTQARYLLHLGQFNEQTGDYRAARAFYTQGLALEAGNPWVRYFLNNNLGYALNLSGEYNDAADLCRRAISINPAKYNACKNLALALEGLGQHAEAAELYLRATELNPMDSRALKHLTDLLERHSEVRREIPHLDDKVARCTRQVEAAQKGH